MNQYKLRAILEFLRSEHGSEGNASNVDDLLVCFGLDRLLSPVEHARVRQELLAMAEADRFIDQLRLTVRH